MSSNPAVYKLPELDDNPITTDLDGWTKVDGSPSMKTWIQHTAKDGTMISGFWEATPGTYHAKYAAYEFVHIIEGEIVITPESGEAVTVGAGDAFVVEADFEGTWEIKQKVRKHFAIRLK